MSHGIFPFSQHFIVAHLLANDHAKSQLEASEGVDSGDSTGSGSGTQSGDQKGTNSRDFLWDVGGTPENPANPRIFGEGENGEHDMKT